MKDFLQAIVYGGAFLVLFVPLIVSDSMFFPYITGKNFTFRILVEIIFAGWILLSFLDVRYRPRFSWIMLAGGAFLLVMFFANLFGEYPLKSFWSNFERMDGYMTLVHFYLYFVVLGHILRTPKMWNYFLHTSLAVASYIAMYGLGQVAGVIDGRNRVDSTLGNATYMAIYMLFHIFILLFVMLRSKQWFTRSLYGIVLILFVYILLETGTRGTFLGLIGGGGLSILYLALFARKAPHLRKAALGGLAVLVVLVGTFIAFKDSSFIQESGSLRRVANIDIQKDLETRSIIWAMAYEGFKEYPLLGWGQGNFNYVFNEQYDPALHSQESWFDRVHNIFFDWLIAGGILGLLTYLSIFVGCLYYLLWKPFFRKEGEEELFTVSERAVLIGLLAGYAIHNLVVFDNLTSYTFFAVILALVHSRVGTDLPSIMQFSVDKTLVTNIIAPVVICSTMMVVYFVNVPGIHASKDIIRAFTSQDIDVRFNTFQEALDRGSFANQEIIEQLTQTAINLSRNKNIAPDVKEKYLRTAENAIQQLVVEKPNDARLHVFFSSFYRSIGQFPLSQDQINIARELSPNKQSIIMEQGILAIQMGDNLGASEYLKVAHELAPEFKTARLLYGASLLHAGKPELVEGVITDEYFTAFSQNDFALSAAEQTKSFDLLGKMFAARIEAKPSVAQNYASLAFIYFRGGNLEKAIETLQSSPVEVELFACYIENIKTDKTPTEGCQ